MSYSNNLKRFPRAAAGASSDHMKSANVIALKEIDPDLHRNVHGSQVQHNISAKEKWMLSDFGENVSNHADETRDDRSSLSVLQRSFNHNVRSHNDERLFQIENRPNSLMLNCELLQQGSKSIKSEDVRVADDKFSKDEDEINDDEDVYYEASPLVPLDAINAIYFQDIDADSRLAVERPIPKFKNTSVSHMKGPLPQNCDPLDLSPLEKYPKRKGYFPFYDNLVDLNVQGDDRSVILSIWQYEFEHQKQKEVQTSDTLPSIKYLFGESEETYYKRYPWSQFVYKKPSCEPQPDTKIEYDVDDFIDYIYRW